MDRIRLLSTPHQNGRWSPQSWQSAKRFSSRWNWDSPTPLAAGECALPPFGPGGRAHSLPAKGVGESQFQRGDIHCGALYILILCGGHYLSLFDLVCTHMYYLLDSPSILTHFSALLFISHRSLFAISHSCYKSYEISIIRYVFNVWDDCMKKPPVKYIRYPVRKGLSFIRIQYASFSTVSRQISRCYSLNSSFETCRCSNSKKSLSF